MRIAYGRRAQIQEAIAAGTIPVETLIITSDELDTGELFFLDKEKNLKRVERKNKFLSLSEAKMWASYWGIVGDVISVKVADNKWEIGIVDDNKEIVMQGSGSSGGSEGVVPGNALTDFPAVGDKGKIYVDTSDQSLYLWDEASSAYILVGSGYNNLIYSGGDAYGN